MEKNFLNAKEISQIAFKKKIWSPPWGSLPLDSSGCPCALQNVFCHWCRDTGCLCLHRAPVLTVAAQPSQGWSDVICQSLTRVDCPPRELTLCSAKCSRDISPLSMLLSRQVPFPSIKTIIRRDFLTAQQVGSRKRQRASSTWHPTNPKASSPNKDIYFKPC